MNAFNSISTSISSRIAYSLFSASWFLLVSPSIARSETWDEIRSIAISQNATMKSSVLDMNVADEDISLSRSGYFPNLKASLSKTRNIDPEPYGTSTSNRLAITASQNIFAGFADKYSVIRAEYARKGLESQKQIDSASIRSLLKKTFNYGLYIKEGIVLARKALDRREENVRIVNLRYEGGRENKSSALKTEASKLDVEADLKFYLSTYEITKQEVAKIIGIIGSPITDFTGSLEIDRPIPKVELLTHPKLVFAEAEQATTAAKINESRAGWFPQLTADASASKSGQNQTLDSDPSYSIGLSLNVPLYNPTQSPKYRESVLQHAKSEIKLAEAKGDIDIDIKKALNRLGDAKSRAQIAAKLLEADKLQAEVYRQRYTLGMVSFQDWDTSESEFIKAERDLLTAKRELADAWAELDQANGRGLEEQGS